MVQTNYPGHSFEAFTPQTGLSWATGICKPLGLSFFITEFILNPAGPSWLSSSQECEPLNQHQSCQVLRYTFSKLLIYFFPILGKLVWSSQWGKLRLRECLSFEFSLGLALEVVVARCLRGPIPTYWRIIGQPGAGPKYSSGNSLIIAGKILKTFLLCKELGPERNELN